MPKISIIVPVYNVQKYLDKCLDSLVNQTLEDIEIIVVNDGSPDNSQMIIDQYVEYYPGKVIPLIKENGGLADARNYGIPHAKSDIIGFIDSDDYVDLNMYEKMYNKMIEDDSDICVCDIEFVYEEDNKKGHVMSGMNQKIDTSLKKRAILSPLAAWNKIYKKNLFVKNNIKYPVGLWYEDIPTTISLFVKAKNISYVKKPFVKYLQRDSSIMGAKDDPRMYHIFDILNLTFNFFVENDLVKEYYEELEYLFIEHLMLYGNFRFLETNDYKNLINKSIKETKEKFPAWKKNKYISYLNKKNTIFIYTINQYNMFLYKWYLKR